MAFTEFEYKELSNTGTSEHDLPDYNGGIIQVAAVATSATGTLTVTVKPENSGSYQLATDGTSSAVIDLTDPEPVLLNGRFDGVKLTASNGADTYEVYIVG